VDNVYSAENDAGLLWNDADLNIDWQFDINDLVLSDKDKNQPNFNSFNTPF